MRKPIIPFAARALLLAALPVAALPVVALPVVALPAWAQSAPAPGYDARATVQWNAAQWRDHCASNSGQRDPNCVVADTGSSTYRDSDAAGWIGTTLGEAPRLPR